MADPIGDQIDKLYINTIIRGARVTTHANMVLDSQSYSGVPTIYTIDVDETTGLTDVDYYWDGVEFKLKSGGSPTVTVDTYEQAVPLFTGTSFKKINVMADFAYNDGQKSFYTYDPVLGVAFLGIDFNYTE